ncbi:MAG: hypothetical protein U0163_01455 [Gemmatimonadaceae bacterium]
MSRRRRDVAAPIIVAAGLVQGLDVLGDPAARTAVAPAGIVLARCVTAFVVGVGAIEGLMWVVRRAPLHGSVGWCVVVGGGVRQWRQQPDFTRGSPVVSAEWR